MSHTLEVYAVPPAILDGAETWEQARVRAEKAARRMATARPWIDQSAAGDLLRRNGVPADDVPDGWWHRDLPSALPSLPAELPDGWRVACISAADARAMADRYAVALKRLRGNDATTVTDYLEGIDLVLAALGWLGDKARAAGQPEPGLLAILRPTDG
ncbi:MAG: hypothetical protein V9G15_08455 [Dermatophilaceae bacterium]